MAMALTALAALAHRLSIGGRRIAWAVNLKGQGRIVALTLR
jgi:hypothetical protein